VHVPFCVRKCGYCDFYSVASREHLIDAYMRALKAELSHARREVGPLSLRSLYLGGGTPTVLSTDLIGGLLECAAELFDVAADAEITCECNPGTVTPTSLRELRAAGVNRLSVGVQSLRDDELRSLGRVHTAEEARDTVLSAREADFANVSVDLIYCLPGQTDGAWEATLDEALALAPSHVSAYCLQIEDGTPLAERVARGEVIPLPEEAQAARYGRTVERLERAGFRQYEVSNFAPPGAECRHNLVYWRNEPYLGAGAGAWSFLNGERRQNAADLDAYLGALAAGESPVAYRERCTGVQAANETLMMGLRLREGLDLVAFVARHGRDLTAERGVEIARLEAEGWVTRRADRLALTTAGMPVAGEITARLALDEEE